MSQPRADTRSLSEVEQATFRTFLDRYANDVETALRKMRRAQARHIEHVGGPTAAEIRDVWECEFSRGPSKRQIIPDQYALLWALADTTRTTDGAALESGQPGMDEFDASGLHGYFRSHIMEKFSPYQHEAFYQTCSRRVFTRKRLAEYVHSLLPGVISQAQTIRDMEGLIRLLSNLPAWVLEAIPAGDGVQTAPQELEAVSQPAPAQHDSPSSDAETPASNPLELCEVCTPAPTMPAAASTARPRKRALARRR